MKIFIDIGHPAHVHYFRNFINILSDKGDSFLITARNKDVAHKLLNRYNINYIDRGTGKVGLFRKFIYMFKADFLLYKVAKQFKPDIFMSFSSPYAAHVAYLLNVPHISFTDTEHAVLGNMAFIPFTKKILTPLCFNKDYGKKHIRFDSYMELCYLHPNYFSADSSVLNLLGLNKDEKYTIIRFVSWQATHDFGHKGISIENKIMAVKEFEKYGKVFISSEGKLPHNLERFRINIPSNKMHDVLAYASLLYGESATMASECSVLGTPSIFVDNIGRCYTKEQEEKYKIVFNFSETLEDQKASIDKGIELLKLENSKNIFKERSLIILKDKIDTTEFMINFVNNYR